MILPRQIIYHTQRLITPLVITRNSAHLSSHRPAPEKKHYRLWSIPGMLVLKKDILAKQHLIYVHPGLNAGIDERRTIYALCDGIMIITEEEFDPDWDFPLVDTVYTTKDGDRQPPTHMRYIHVIPKRRVSEHKLVDVV